MDYILLFLFGWMVLCLPAIIVAVVSSGRRRREIAELESKLTELRKRVYVLEHRTEETHAAQAASSITALIEPAKPAAPVVQAPSKIEQPIVAPVSQPSRPIAPVQQPPHVEQRPQETPAIPLKPAALPKPAIVEEPKHAAPIAASSQLLPPKPPVSHADASAQVRAASSFAGFSSVPASHEMHATPKKKLSLEETVGTNWLPKLGITIVVIGVGFLVAAKWGSFAPWLRVVLLYLCAFAALAGGIFTERKERYQKLGRSLIGGGWAVTALVTYGLQHAPFMAILSSNAADLLLLFAVIGIMVWHTLKYNSQLVTGASFLLGFAAIMLNPDPPYNLIAGLLLVTGMTVIVLRRHWYELEVSGILACYLSHFYWLYSVFSLQPVRAPFPHLTASLALTLAYWMVFRCSYVWRKVSSHEEEAVSTIAGLLNPLLFMGVMKYQSFHPEWAFYALLVLGAVEFTLGQLPVSRRRKAPFQVLSSLGAALMVAAVPFKFSGSSLETLWLAGGEAFLLAGIFTRERLFRTFGLLISGLIVVYSLPVRIAPLLQELTNGQAHYHLQLGIVLAVIAAVLYLNSHVISVRWKELFTSEQDGQALIGFSFAASFFAVCSIYSLIDDKAIAIVLALLVFALSFLAKQFSISALVYQAHWIAALAAFQTVFIGENLKTGWNGIPERVLTFVPVAALLYVSGYNVRLSKTQNKIVFAGGYTTAASGLLAILIALQAPERWIGTGWIALALLLGLAARYWKDRALLWQTHVLSFLAAIWTLAINFAPQYRGSAGQLIGVGATAGLLYLLTWIINVPEIIWNKSIPPAYSWAGSLLLSWLIWYQLPPIDVALAWGMLGLALFLVGDWRSWSFLRIQSYIALAFSFGHIFYANFNVLSTPGSARPEVVTVIPLVGVYFYIYWHLLNRGDKSATLENKIRVEHLIACLGTATLAALARFELPLEMVAVGYAALVAGTLLVAWFTKLQVFVYQALVLAGFAAFRVAMFNFYNLHEAYGSSLSSAVFTIAILAAGVPICLFIRKEARKTFTGQQWVTMLVSHPEQPMFFVPFVLMAVLLALKVPTGMITLAWGAQAVVVFVLALWAKERSFRLSGLGLLLCCVAKIVVWDAWHLNITARYLTLIGVGVLIMVVHYLISRNREALREYL